jgi:hypothetical protein
MKKAITAIALLIVMTLSTFTALATNVPVSFVINGKTYYVSNEPTPYGDPAANPIAHPDNPIQTRALIVTASDVWRLTNNYGHGDEYTARGYVTAAAYHYSRAEMWWNNKVDATGFTEWGTGQVYSNSNFTMNPGTAKIFYGS